MEYKRDDKLDITSVNYSGQHEATCISVTGSDQLFITNDFIVTHNTWAILVDNLQGIHDPQYFSAFFRSTTTEIDKGLWPEALRLYEPYLKYQTGKRKGKFIGKARIHEKTKTITFPTGARSVFTYLEQDKHADS